MGRFRYRAFISYSHKDKKWAYRLLRAIENYRIPKDIQVRGSIPSNDSHLLTPIFLDRFDLPASDCLESKLDEALSNSEALIVICSPDSAKSTRVNMEVSQFLQYRSSKHLFCVIVGGRPNAEERLGRPELECFPPALLSARGKSGKTQTPVAVDCRKNGDGLDLAVIKLIAGLLKVDLHTLLRRHLRRRNRKQLLVASLGMIILTATATLYFKAAIAQREAFKQMTEAESLVWFLTRKVVTNQLHDINRKEVAERALEYYVNRDLSKLHGKTLANSALTMMELGRFYLEEGNYTTAHDLLVLADTSAQKLTDIDTEDPDTLFIKGKVKFQLGVILQLLGKRGAAFEALQEHLNLSKKLVHHSPNNMRYLTEMANASLYLGRFFLDARNDPMSAQPLIENSLEKRRSIYLKASGDDKAFTLSNYAGAYEHLANIYEYQGKLNQALHFRKDSLRLYEQLSAMSDENPKATFLVAKAKLRLGVTELFMDNSDTLTTLIADTKKLLETQTESFPYTSAWRGIILDGSLALTEYAYSKGRKEEASALLGKIHFTEPPENATYNELSKFMRKKILASQVLLSSGQTSQAVSDLTELLTKSLKKWPKLQSTHKVSYQLCKIHFLLAEAAKRNGDLQRAHGHLQGIVSISNLLGSTPHYRVGIMQALAQELLAPSTEREMAAVKLSNRFSNEFDIIGLMHTL